MKFLFFDFKILFAIIFIFIISDENVNQVFSQIHVRIAYLFLYLRSRYICYRKRAVTVPYCYRMLAHSHSATSLYNLGQFKPISDPFTSIVYIVPASNLRTGIVSPRVIRVILCHFHILAPKIC